MGWCHQSTSHNLIQIWPRSMPPYCVTRPQWDQGSIMVIPTCRWHRCQFGHYGDVIMGAIASQITSLTIIYSTDYSDADQRKHQSSASMAFVRGIHRGPVNSPHKWPVTQKMFPFDASSCARGSANFMASEIASTGQLINCVNIFNHWDGHFVARISTSLTPLFSSKLKFPSNVLWILSLCELKCLEETYKDTFPFHQHFCD